MVFCFKIHSRTAVSKEGPVCGKLQQEPESQGTHIEAGWATSHG